MTYVNNPLQMLSRTKPATGPGSNPAVKDSKKKKKEVPKLDDLLEARDFTGAMALCEVSYNEDIRRVTNYLTFDTFSDIYSPTGWSSCVYRW